MTPMRIALALVHRDGRWLVARRLGHVHLGGYWEFPGGKCEPGEAPERAAVREAREECAIEVQAERGLGEFIQEYPDRSLILIPVVCRWVSGDAQPLASTECRWVTVDELPGLRMPPVNARIIAALVGQYP